MAQYSTTNLIVNYLPQEMSDEELRHLFDSQVPGVKSVKICRNNVTGYSYGYGFCEYESQEIANQAIVALNRRQVGSKTLKVAFARLRSDQTRNCKLRLSNLPAWMTQETLQSALAQYGSIINCKALLDPQGSCRGIGFCLYETRSSAEQAMAGLNGKPWPGLDSLPIQVRFADQNEKKVRPPSQQYQHQQQPSHQHTQSHHGQHQPQSVINFHHQQQHGGSYRPQHYAAHHYAPPLPPPPQHHHPHHHQQQHHHLSGYAAQPAWAYNQYS